MVSNFQTIMPESLEWVQASGNHNVEVKLCLNGLERIWR
jgi:hypothetical protein